MTVQTLTSRADYTGNGSTTAFTVPFYFLDNTHIQVIRTQISTGVATTLALTTDYTVTGAGVPAGGTVTALVAPTIDQRLSILRNVPFTQLIHYVPNDPFPAATHEMALDQLTMEVQQLAEISDRSLTLPPNALGVSTELPYPVANNLIGWSPDALSLVNTPLADLATTIVANTWTTDRFSGDGVTTVFTLSHDPGNQNATFLSISGVAQVPGVDFTVAGTLLTFTSAPPVGTNNIAVQYGQTVSTIGAADLTNTTGTLDGSKLSGSIAAALVSGQLTNATGVTAAQFDNDTSLATTAFVQRALGNMNGINVYSVNTVIPASASGSWNAANANSVTLTLPLLSACPTGTVMSFYGNDATGTVIATQGGDTLSLGSTGYVSSMSLGRNDRVAFVNATGAWLAIYGEGALIGSTSFAASLAANGYQKLPSGLIVQWGTSAAVNAGASVGVTFPLSFPTAVYSITASPLGTGTSASTGTAAIGSLAVSGFTIYNWGSTINFSNGVGWFAVGK